MDLQDWREDYTQAELRSEDLQEDPFNQFELWFQQACNVNCPEPNAMVLATASATIEYWLYDKASPRNSIPLSQ
jgi:pyridoxamine 5'-phosphate oxidase